MIRNVAYSKRIKLPDGSLANAVVSYLALFDHMHNLGLTQQDAGATKLLEREHGVDAPLDCPVILFDEVVQILPC